MSPVLIYILIVVGQLFIKAFGDWWYKAKKKKIINHVVSVAIDGVIYVLAAYFLFCAPDWCSLRFMFGIIALSAGFRWIFYDLLYNFINNHKWSHYGGSSLVDKFQKKMGKYHMVTKFGLVVLGIILILI